MRLSFICTLILSLTISCEHFPGDQVSPIEEVLVEVTELGSSPTVLSVNNIVLTISATIGMYPRYQFSRIVHDIDEDRINVRVYALHDPTEPADSLVTIDAMRYLIPTPAESHVIIIVHQPDSSYIVEHVDITPVRADPQWSIYTMASSNLPSHELRALTVTPNGEIWGATYTDGVFRFDGESAVTMSGNLDSLRQQYILAMTSDRNGNVWVGSFNSAHISKFDGINWTLFELPDADSIRYGYGDIYSIYADNDGTVWVGTDHGHLVSLSGNTWRKHPEIFDRNSYRTIESIIEDKTGNIWIGGEWGSFEMYDRTTWIFFESLEYSISDQAVAPNGDHWVSTYNQLLRLNGGNWESFSITTLGLNIKYIEQLAVDSQNNLWMTTERGLLRYDHSSWTLYDSTNSGFYGNWLSDIAIDSQDRIWMATDEGLLLFRNGN